MYAYVFGKFYFVVYFQIRIWPPCAMSDGTCEAPFACRVMRARHSSANTKVVSRTVRKNHAGRLHRRPLYGKARKPRSGPLEMAAFQTHLALHGTHQIAT